MFVFVLVFVLVIMIDGMYVVKWVYVMKLCWEDNEMFNVFDASARRVAFSSEFLCVVMCVICVVVFGDVYVCVLNVFDCVFCVYVFVMNEMMVCLEKRRWR